MVKMSGGEALAKSLAKEGVDVVFGIPGIQIYGIVAAIRDEPGIRMVTTRHEQAATYMADGYARVGKAGRGSRGSRRRSLQRRLRPGHRVCPLLAGALRGRTDSAPPDGQESWRRS